MSAVRLPPRTWPLVARMLLWRLTLPVAKRIVSLERLVGWMAAPRQRPRDRAREALAVRVASRLWRASDGPCLGRSLALYRELGRSGARPELVCGMAREEGSLVGHCWVELDGRALLEAETPTTRWAVVVRFDTVGDRA